MHRARVLGGVLGCDGAHSIVRKTLGLRFEGGAFPEEYMLGDVEVDWELPSGYAVRAMHQSDGRVDDLLVCIPLPGRNRYRMSMLVPPELSLPQQPSAEEVLHGLEAGPTPGLPHIQAVLDRLSPQPTRASALRWSSVFRISHRLVDRYGAGRDGLVLPVVHDGLDAFRQMYGARGGEGFLIRPDGYLGLRDAPVSGPALVAHLALTFRG